MEILAALREERLALVARLRDLPADDWARPSLCAGWTVRHVLAHLVTPFLVSPPEMVLHVVRHRGVSGAMHRVACRLAERPPAELVDLLESHAGSAVHPPGLPLTAPFTDVVVHSADIRWGLGDPHEDWAGPERLRPVLDFVVGPWARAGFAPPGRLRGLRLVADDVAWAYGRGAEVAGPSLALAMGALGRGAALSSLRGDGVAVLAGRTGC